MNFIVGDRVAVYGWVCPFGSAGMYSRGCTGTVRTIICYSQEIIVEFDKNIDWSTPTTSVSEVHPKQCRRLIRAKSKTKR